jgi:hypothetical protein
MKPLFHMFIHLKFLNKKTVSVCPVMLYVGILKTGYPRIQALSQDEQGVHPRAAT